MAGLLGCVILGCEKPKKCRGLCHRHYRIASEMVRDGGTTWEELERAGEALPVPLRVDWGHRGHREPARSQAKRRS